MFITLVLILDNVFFISLLKLYVDYLNFEFSSNCVCMQ